MFTKPPEPPYYAVIFSSQRTQGDAGYGATAERMADLAATYPGYLGIESVRDAQGFGITVSYWRSLDEIAAWKRDTEHLEAQRQGRQQWYSKFQLQIAKVERVSGWEALK